MPPATPDRQVSREVRLASRPTGEPTLRNVTIAKVETPQLTDGQALVRNLWMSVDAYMRGRMDEGESYIPAFAIDAALDGSAVGEAVASRTEALPVGATVSHFLGWREYAVVDAASAAPIDTTLAPVTAYLGPLGTTGLTAYVSLTEIAPVQDGDGASWPTY